MRKLEVLADAILTNNQYLKPDSLFYKLRNPGGLKGFIDRHKKDDSGYRVFDSHLDGYRALIHDLEVKCGGRSAFGVGPQTPLKQALSLFSVNDSNSVVHFIQSAFGNDKIDGSVPLAFFFGEE